MATALLEQAVKKIRLLSVSAVGIDVAKASLSVYFRDPEGSGKALTICNTETDIKEKILPLLVGFTGRIVLESTNHYHWSVTLILREAGYDVRVVNPILAKQYTSSNIRKVKTDPIDAQGLARMAALADNLPPTFSETRNDLALRKKLSALATMSKQLQALKANMKQLREAQTLLGLKDESNALKTLTSSINHLKRTMELMEDEFVTASKVSLTNKQLLSNFDSIPGVTPFVALLALHWFHPLTGRDAKSWIAFAGLDISSRESGTWTGTCRLTKRGNNFLRRRLYSAAWGSTMKKDGPFKLYYESLREQGRSHVEALLIIARKLIRIMFAIMKSGEVFDPSKFTSNSLPAKLST